LAPLTYEQAAAVVGITVRHLHKLIADGDGPRVATDSRISCVDLGEWIGKRAKRDDFQAERTRLTKAQADKTELEVAELAGELVRAEEVAQAWGEKIGAAASRLKSLPSKLAQRVAAPGKTAEVQALAQDAVFEALNELAGDGLPERTRSRRQAHQDNLAPAAKVDGKRVGRQTPKVKPRVKRGAGAVADELG